jgi:uncharacterized protein (DUF2225 family)
MLISLDDKGIVNALNMKNKQWIPILDQKSKFGSSNQIWVVGFMEHKLMYIELQKDQIQPHEQLKSKYKVTELRIPFVFPDKEEHNEKKDQEVVDFEEAHFRQQFILEHEQYRREVWLPFKLFRGSNDNERFLSETILELKELNQKKKELDKQMISAIRLAILNDDHEKVFTYIEKLHFTPSIRIVIKLCNELNQNLLA